LPSIINATGIIFYNIKKGPLFAEEAAKAVGAAPLSPYEGYEKLYGEGALIHKHLKELLCNFTGAEDVLVTNNIQSAAFLVFHSLASKAKILLCREELISDKFAAAMAVILKQSGATLKKLAKQKLISLLEKGGPFKEEPFCLVSIDGWNFAAGEEEPFVPNFYPKSAFGSVKILCCAALMDPQSFGFPGKIQVKRLLERGFDIIIFPGDKIIGGPALGIIAGKRQYISLFKKNPLLPALSPDSILMAALKATVELYTDEKKAREKIPLLRMLTDPVENIAERAQRLAEALRDELQGSIEVELVGEKTRLTPICPSGKIPSCQIALKSSQLSAKELRALLFRGEPPVMARIKKDKILLDLRTVPQKDDPLLHRSILTSLRSGQKGASSSAGSSVLDSVSSLIWVLDRGKKLHYANKAADAFFGVKAGGLRGKSLTEVLGDEEGALLEKICTEVLQKGEQTRLEIKLNDHKGNPRWLDITVAPLINNLGEIENITFTATDITERKISEDELKYSSMHDPLTGLYNRVYFEEEIRRLNAERHYPVSVIVCDVDELKLINDTMGHSRGDELLKKAAEIIRKPFRSSDVVARVGGDEFAVILPSTDETTVKEIAARIHRALEEYNREKGILPLSLSVGFATGFDPLRGINEIFKQADSNMYKNKFERKEGVKKKIIDHLLSLLAEKEFRDEKYEERLQRMVLLLGQAIGLPYEELKNIMLLAKIHDIGKVGIDDSILFKRGSLDRTEWEEIKRHPEIGCQIARSSKETAPVADYILQHHEHWNGKGYPRGLKGVEIHLYSRILAIIDAYEAMTSPRPYRGALSHEEAIREIKKNSGTQFDPRLVDIFISLME